MSNKSIIVEQLSKKYWIGNNVHGTLRHTLQGVFTKKKRKVEFWALKDVNFSINEGEAVGIIGKNGAGKSTLLKILSKITIPTKGRATLNGRVASLLEVGTGFHPELTGKENIFLNGSLLGMSRSEINSKFSEIVDFSGIERFINTPVKHYSSGMYVRLAFSIAAHLETEILLVDEVLAVGDVEFQNKCMGKMDEVARGGKTVILVSHNESAIRSLTSKVILLEAGKIAKIGSPNSIYQEYNNSKINRSYKSYSIGSIVKSVDVYYDRSLKIEVEYAFTNVNQFPHLGYVVTSKSGERLFGGNPSFDNIKLDGDYSQVGTVRITVEQPLLRIGTYNVSIYFGNGLKDIFIDENCVSFKVESEITNIGFILPQNKYEFL